MSQPWLTAHDEEPIRGLPAPLPANETLLWQGSPEPLSLAQRAYGVRAVVIYFGFLLALRLAEAGSGEWTGNAWMAEFMPTVVLAACATGLLGFLAWLNARETLYTLTDKRLVLRFGVALPMTVNIPLTRVEAADLRLHRDGTGDIAFRIARPERISWLVFWPHVRPWQWTRPQPCLRGIRNPARVAELLRMAAATAPENAEPA